MLSAGSRPVADWGDNRPARRVASGSPKTFSGRRRPASAMAIIDLLMAIASMAMLRQSGSVPIGTATVPYRTVLLQYKLPSAIVAVRVRRPHKRGRPMDQARREACGSIGVLPCDGV